MKHSFKTSFMLLLTLLLLVVNAVGATPAYAATLVVTSLSDSGAGSLRNTIAGATAGDTITFNASLSGQTIRLASTLVIDKNLTIDGASLASQITISGDTDNNNTGNVRVFLVNSGVSATLKNLTVAKGMADTFGTGFEAEGGGVMNLGTLTVSNSTFQDNTATYAAGNNETGGAIANHGTLTVTNTTFLSNTSTFLGGAVYNHIGATMTVANSTFSGNTATSQGGGIFNAATLTVINSTFSGNSAGTSNDGGGILNFDASTLNLTNTIIANSTAGGDCYNAIGGTIGTNINNLVEDGGCSASLSGDPNLGAIASNGGPNKTFALLTGSTALGAGNVAACSASPVNNLDQRGRVRPQGEANCDLGAYESSTGPAAPAVSAPVGTINDATPTVSGTAEPYSTVDVLRNLTPVCSDVPVNGLGNWSCVSSALTDGAVQLKVNATDAANNTSADTTHSFNLDSTPPAAPLVTAPTGTTGDATPTISGTAEANSTVNVLYNLTPVCSNVAVNGAGTWSCDSSVTFPAGSVELKVNATDALANKSADTTHSFTVDTTAPTVSSIVRVNANNTGAASVDFTVTFSKPVKDVDANDFALHTTGMITGASVSGVTGSNAIYTVTVNTGSKNGTIRLDVPNTATISDLVGNALSGLPFSTGEAYTIFKTNGTDTTGVFRPSNGLLYLKHTNDTGFADVAINYGLGGDYPVVGDWDGNGTVTIGIYRGGKFYLRNSNTLGFADLVIAFGVPGDQPVAGDWDGDGVDTIGVYRSSTGLFLLRNSNTAGDAEMSFILGNPGDVGIAGDWNGDGLDTTGVFRPSNGFLFLKNTNATGFADLALNYGLSGDQPVTGDWDNDGVDTIGVYRNGTFLLRNSNTLGFADLVFGLGNPGDMPIAGNWDASIP